MQATPLLVYPDMIITLLSPQVHQPSGNSKDEVARVTTDPVAALEEYFARSSGLALTTLAILSLLLTGYFPLSSTFEDGNSCIGRCKSYSADSYLDSNVASSNPYAVPTLLVTIFYHASTAFFTYSRYFRTGQSTFALAAAASSSLAALGLWVLLFGEGSRISKRTGADKRTSGWPFGNAEADKKRVAKKHL